MGRLLVVVVLCGVSSVAVADATRQRARSLAASGGRAYELGDYSGALHDLSEAYRLAAVPELLFNIGQCYRQLRQYEEAARSFRAYLRNAPATVERAMVEQLIAVMEHEREAAAEREHEKAAATAAGPAPTVNAPPVLDTVALAPLRPKQAAPPVESISATPNTPRSSAPAPPAPMPAPATPAPMPAPATPAPMPAPATPAPMPAPATPAPVLLQVPAYESPRAVANGGAWACVFLGAALSTAGGVLLWHGTTLDDQRLRGSTVEARDSAAAQEPFYVGAGWASIGLGAALLVSGVVMFGVSSTAERKHRHRTTSLQAATAL